MGNYSALVRHARIMASPPEMIADYLCGRSAEEVFEDIHDLEPALLELNNALIDIALAQNCGSHEVATQLFLKASCNKPVRLAVLSNTNLKFSLLSEYCIPYSIFGGNLAAVSEYLSEASEEEICAIFENPRIEQGFLTDFLYQKISWDKLDEDRIFLIISLLSKNPRMSTPSPHNGMDDLTPDYYYRKVFSAALSLAGKVPSNKIWASFLSKLYKIIPDESVSIEDKIEMANLWADEANDDGDGLEDDKETGTLSGRRLIRNKLALSGLHASSNELESLLKSKDVAFRCAAYQVADVSIWRMMAALMRDKRLAFSALVKNRQSWDGAWKIKLLKKFHADNFYFINEQFSLNYNINIKKRAYNFPKEDRLSHYLGDKYLDFVEFRKVAKRQRYIIALLVVALIAIYTTR